MLQNIKKEAWKLRGVKHVLATIGSGGTAGVTSGTVYVALSDLSERTFSQFEVMADARKMLKEKFPGLRSGFSPCSESAGEAAEISTSQSSSMCAGRISNSFRNTQTRFLKSCRSHRAWSIRIRPSILEIPKCMCT